MYLRWPTFESRDREESQHRFGNVIEVKTLLLPKPVPHNRLIHITVVIFQISTPEKKKNVLYPCSAVSSALRTLEACSSRIPRIRLFSLTFAHLRVTFCLLDALSNKFLYYSAICRREFEDLKCSRIRIAILSFVIVRNVYRYNIM